MTINRGTLAIFLLWISNIAFAQQVTKVDYGELKTDVDLTSDDVIKILKTGTLSQVKNIFEANKWSVNKSFGGPRGTPDYPIHEAILRGDLDIINYLIAKGADLEKRYWDNKIGYTALQLALFKQKSLSLIKSLIEKGAKINATRAFGSPALTLAILSKKPAVVKYLIDNGALLKKYYTGSLMSSPLAEAIYANSLEMVKALVEKGARADEFIQYSRDDGKVLTTSILDYAKLMQKKYNNADIVDYLEKQKK